MTNKIEQYKKKIEALKTELASLPNMARTKAQYSNLIDKIEKRNDLENIEIEIEGVKTSVLDVLKLAVEKVETPKEVKEKRKQINKDIHTYKNKILIELGVIETVPE